MLCQVYKTGWVGRIVTQKKYTQQNNQPLEIVQKKIPLNFTTALNQYSAIVH